MANGYGTDFINHVDKGLRVIPQEATDRVALILTGEDDFDQGGEFMQSERASDQTPAGWNTEVWRVGTISTLYKIGEGRAKDVPLSDIEIVAVSQEPTGRVSSRGPLGV